MNLYVSVYFETGDEEYASIKELADTRDMFLETLTVTTDYEGKEESEISGVVGSYADRGGIQRTG